MELLVGHQWQVHCTDALPHQNEGAARCRFMFDSSMPTIDMIYTFESPVHLTILRGIETVLLYTNNFILDMQVEQIANYRRA